MKRIYWRPQKASRTGLAIVSLAAALGLWMVFDWDRGAAREIQPTAIAAATRAHCMMEELRVERERRGIEIDAAYDPAQSGMIGTAMSMVTSKPSNLASKQTSVNPNFAAAIVSMLHEAGVQPGDTVAVAWTGSFPALNVCVAAALDAMEVKPLVIASVASSQYGANHPDFMWLDMEAHLSRHDLLKFRSHCATPGAGADRGLGLNDAGRSHLEQVARRNNTPWVVPLSRQESVDVRLKTYRDLAQGEPIAAFVNVGGGVASTGGERAKGFFKPGLNQSVRSDFASVHCAMGWFAKQGLPVIHLNHAQDLAARFSLAETPTVLPDVIRDRLIAEPSANRPLAAIVLVVVLAGMRVSVLCGRSQRAMTAWYRKLNWRRAITSDQAPCEGDIAFEPQLMV